MADSVLWRRLTRTDFDAINGQAAPSGSGGGAMHIALGTDSSALPIVSFLNAGTSTSVTVNTQPLPPAIPAGSLTFDGNPNRRNGEWRITDQYSHRHPAWSTGAGFPTAYAPQDRPIVLVIERNGSYFATFSSEVNLRTALPALASVIDASTNRHTGITTIDSAWPQALGLASPGPSPSSPAAAPTSASQTPVSGGLVTSGSNQVPPSVPTSAGPASTPASKLADYANIVDSPESENLTAFDPNSVSDGRQKILTEVVRRQGQRSFRKKLLVAYGKECAISRSSVEVTLEAAHITPYLGPQTNHPANGILLRADLHTLFDLGLITIDPDTMKVMVSTKLEGTEYASLQGKSVKATVDPGTAPSKDALIEHRKSFVP